MFMLSKEFRFEASHQLPDHDGKCARLHGHSWVAKVYLRRGEVEGSGPKRGMVMDFYDVSRAMAPLLEKHLDHWHLNDTVSLNPTSENVARWIYNELLRAEVPFLAGVAVEETCTSCAWYWPDQPNLELVHGEDVARRP